MIPSELTEFLRQIKKQDPSIEQIIWNSFVSEVSNVEKLINVLLYNQNYILINTGDLSSSDYSKIIQKFKEHGWTVTKDDFVYSEITETIILKIKIELPT